MKSGQESRGGDYMDMAKESAASAVDKSRDVAGGAMDKARDAASGAMDKAKDAASGAMDKAKDVATDFGKKAEDATHAVGSGMKSLAGSMRESLPKEGVLGTASSTVARGLEASGKYLESEGLAGIAEDMTNVIRRNPIPALFVGVGLGFLLARATTTHHRS